MGGLVLKGAEVKEYCDYYIKGLMTNMRCGELSFQT